MSELRRMIQAHLDKYGVTRSEFARRAGVAPQTVQNWWDKPTTLPKSEHLHGVAEVIGVPYSAVLAAALVDAGYRESAYDEPDAIAFQLEHVIDDAGEVKQAELMRAIEDLVIRTESRVLDAWAARRTDPKSGKGRSEQGEADGEESQDA